MMDYEGGYGGIYLGKISLKVDNHSKDFSGAWILI